MIEELHDDELCELFHALKEPGRCLAGVEREMGNAGFHVNLMRDLAGC